MALEAAYSAPQRPGPLRLRRLALGLKQSEVAHLAGVSREQVIRLEAGTCDPHWRTAVALAAALESEPAELFPLKAPNEKRPAGRPGALTTSAGQGRRGEA